MIRPAFRRIGMLAGVAALALALPAQSAEPLRVVATFSVLADMTRQVAGDHARVETLAPVGAEVHEHELAPSDFVNIERADLVLVNGYTLEQWMDQLESAAGVEVPVIAVAEATGAETLPITVGDFEGEPDPHLWMNPEIATRYVEVITDALADLVPEAEEGLRANAEAYTTDIARAAEEAAGLLAEVPEDQRLLITSEAAFLYFADAFGWRHEGVWGSNAETEGTPSQIRRIVDLVEAESPRAVFYESTISDRHVRAVSEDTGVAVHGPLYVDSLGEDGTGAETYPGMLRVTARTIAEAMSAE